MSGVGYFPRKLQKLYVKYFRGYDFRDTQLFSYWDVDTMLRLSGWGHYRIILPSIADGVILPHPKSRRAKITRFVKTYFHGAFGPLQLLEKVFWPSFDIIAYKQNKLR